MEFFDTVNTRCSIRVFENDDVSPEQIEQILGAANRAPSAGNLQAYDVVIVRDAAKRQELAEVSFKQMYIATAPVVLVFFANPDRNREKYGELGENLLALQDATIACAYAELAVHALGLGTVWIGGFSEQRVREITGAPASWRPIGMLPIGKKGESPEPRERRLLSELLRQEKA